ncbi:MAG: putative pterin-4-alpha-carbinolamine dehydratase [Frankiales bacterium]|nr:putative pterin-4-alpha-carbinolamine dehydratase [Frankiales bacterium]
MATLLDETLIADSLNSLPGWEGDSSRLWRDVHLDEPATAELRRQLAVDAEAMGHAPSFEGDRIVLTTTEAGGVTELDIMMASHISDLLHRLSHTEPGIEAVNDDEAVASFRPATLTGEPELPRTNTAMLES